MESRTKYGYLYETVFIPKNIGQANWSMGTNNFWQL
jgi:hypothetical protein